MSLLSQPHFHSEAAAIARLEAIVWPQGPFCPRCGGFDRITAVKGGRAGLRRCGPCKREFTATVGTIFERSHIKLHKWFQAAHLMASSKKGNQRAPITSNTKSYLQNRLVYGASVAGGNARVAPKRSAWWRRQNRRVR